MLTDILRRNQTFYESVWRRARLRGPEWFNTWPVAGEAARESSRRLEIGPGMRPRFPIAGTCCADISAAAARQLQKSGAQSVLASADALPFRDGYFDAVCAIDVVEHAKDPPLALRESARVLRPGGRLLLAVPVRARFWTDFDGVVGDSVRFEPDELRDALEKQGFAVRRTAAFGLLPRNRILVRIGAWFLRRFPSPAIWFEDKLVLPLSKPFQRPLEWRPGFDCPAGADGVLLDCEKS